jgi:hypothetical protein
MGGIHPIPPSYLEKNMRSIILIFILVITVGEYFSLYAQQDSVWENVLINDKWGRKHDVECDSAGRIYLFSARELYRSTDNGISWHTMDWINTDEERNSDFFDNERSLYSLNNNPVMLWWFVYCYTRTNDNLWEKSSIYKDKRIGGMPSSIIFPHTGIIWWVGSETTLRYDSSTNTPIIGSIIARSNDTCRTWNDDLWMFEKFIIKRGTAHSNGTACLYGNIANTKPEQKMILLGGRNTVNLWDTINVLPPGTTSVEYCNDKLFALAYAATYMYDTLSKVWNKVAGLSGLRIVKKNSRELFMFNINEEQEFVRSDSTRKSFAYSSDGGYTWQKVYCATPVFTAVCVPNGTLFGIRSSIYPNLYYDKEVNVPVRSTDNGATWHTIFEKTRLTYVESIASMAQGVLLACADDVFRSTDEGKTWQSMGLAEYPTKSAVEAPDGTLYCSLKIPLYQKIYSDTDIRSGICILTSHDKGKTWTDITPDSILGGREPSIARLSLSPSGSLFAYWGAGMLRRSPEGRWHWVRGIVKPKTISVRCDNICFGPNKTVIAVSPFNMEGVNGGVWHSTDDGETWTKHPLFDSPPWDTDKYYRPTRIEPIAAVYDPIRQYYVLKLNTPDVLLISTDNGKTFQYKDEWREHGVGKYLTCDSLGNYYFNQLAGIRVSSDGGNTWQLFSESNYGYFPGQQPVITSPSGYLWSAEFFSGLFRSRLRFPPVGVKEEEETLSTLRIMPNPANTFLSLSGTDNALVFIADMQGSLVYQGYENSIDISRWQTGMYCARIPATGQKALFMVVR